MREKPSATPSTMTSDQDEPDDSEPTLDRQADLEAAYEANVKAGKPPYARVAVLTRGELVWIINKRLWATTPDRAKGQDRPDLRGIELYGALLKNIHLYAANLAGAKLKGADLSGAILTWANLSGDAGCARINLRSAQLDYANLSDSQFDYGDLSHCDLTHANLAGTNLRGTNLSGAVLTGARMSPFTDLSAVTLDPSVKLSDVVWNGVQLSQVDFDRVPRLLGDESALAEAKTRDERIKAVRTAARAYRELARALQGQGLTFPAIEYRQHAQRLGRRAQLLRFAFGPWLFSWLLNIVSGYGDRPGRALACYLTVVGAFTGTYWAITNQMFGFIQSHSAHLAWYEALVLSISSFHGRGFFPATLSLGDPIALVAAAEAIIGLFIELVFIATFTQRFFAR